MHKRVSLAALLVLWPLMSLISSAESQVRSADKRLLDGLRQRQLFRLAETFCNEQLQQDLSAVERAEFTIELIRTAAQHAIHSAPAAREKHWQRSRDTAASFVATQPDNPRLLLVRVQDALTLLARGELARQEAEVGRNAQEALATALVTVREAIRMLERLEKDIAAEIPKRTHVAGANGTLSVDELIALRNNVRYQLARGFRNRALCYPPHSQDRVAALASAAKMLDQISTELGAGDTLLWDVRIDRVTCDRLLEDPSQALTRIQALEGTATPADVMLRLRAEAIRALIALAQFDQVQRVLQDRRNAEITSAELDFAHLEAYLALWKAATDAGDEAAAKVWRDNRAVATVESIEQQHGAFWGRRANQLLVNRLGTAPASGNLEIMARTADSLYLKKQLDEAIAAYEEAAQQAMSNDDLQSAFALLSKPVLIEQQRGNTAAMITRLRSLAVQLSAHRLASERHLSAIKLCVQLARSDSQYLKLYQELLVEHLATWPTEETADIVRIWLGKVLMARQEWSKAVQVVTEVDLSSTELNQALQQADKCYFHLLRSLEREGKPLQEDLGRALRYFESMVLRDNRLPARWSEAQRTAVLSVAKLHLNYNSAGAARCETILRGAMDGLPPPPPAWRAQAQAWLVVALASQPGKQAAAQAALQQIGGARPEELYKMLMSLSELAATATTSMQSSLASLRLSVAETLLTTGGTLASDEQQSVQFEQADAMATLGRHQDAIALLAGLAQRFPKDGRIQERYADALVASDDRPTLERALAQWRMIGKRSQPKSERWFKAKYNIAHTLFRLGDKKRAADVLGVVQLTTDLNATSWGQQIRELHRRCQQ